MELNLDIRLLADEKNYVDRQCPSENCRSIFKIDATDWAERISGNNCHCPICGFTSNGDYSWCTDEQLEEIYKLAESFAYDIFGKEIDKAFKSFERKANSKYIKVKYNPCKRITFANNPIGHLKEWEQDIECKNCGTKYSVEGFAHFCPCCNNNSEIDEFENALDCEKMRLDSLIDIEEYSIKKYGKDKGLALANSILENSFSDVVSAFQSFACEYYKKIGGTKNVKTNDFQILEKASKLFNEVKGINFEELIDEEDYKFIKKIFQQRHLLEHKNGIVDNKYLENSDDSSYKESQRIVVKRKDAYRGIEIIKNLVNKLLELENNS